MKIETYKEPESSFLSVEKDMNIIVSTLLKNERFKKLLYYTSDDCLDRRNLSQEESLSLFNNNLKIIPKIEIDPKIFNYVTISFDNFSENFFNPHFRNNTIEFDILCHFDQWHLKDFQLRPYRIAAEIDASLNNQHLSGIGTLNFIGACQDIFNDEYGGLAVFYKAVHGDEDKKDMLNPLDEEQFIKDFNEMNNNG